MKHFENDLLVQKKQRFAQAVIQAANTLGFSPPKLNFWETRCPDSPGNDLAHYHPDSNEICIFKSSLVSMDYDDIHDTALHEVTHLLIDGHGSDFDDIHLDLKTSTWENSIGRTHLDPEGAKHRKVKLKPKKYGKGECGYHLCSKQAVSKCSFCKKAFCRAHVQAKPPRMVNRSRNDLDDRIYIEKYKNVGAHPCIEFEEEPSVYEARGLDVYSEEFVESVYVEQDGDEIMKALEKETSKQIKKKPKSKSKPVVKPLIVVKKKEVVEKKKPIEKKKVVNKNGFVRGGVSYLDMFSGRPLQEKKIEVEFKEESISEDVIGFWQWLKSLVGR